MSGYRFCRTDDVPLLVEAWGACYRAHFPDEPALTVEEFKRESRELNLWASSCMLALAGSEPIGVLLAAKREDASWIRGIAVRPGHERQGHGRHLLDSLRRKLAILGPPRILSEVPAALPGALAFFEACGYRPEARYADFVLDEPSRASADVGGIAVPVTLADLSETGCLDSRPPLAWCRSPASLRNLRSELEGLAVFSESRVEAWLLGRSRSGFRDVLGLGHAPDPASRALLGMLLHHLGRSAGLPLHLPKVSKREIEGAVLESWGFRRARDYVGLSITASPD